MKRLVWFTVVVLSTLGAVALLWAIRDVVLLFLISLAVAATLRPIVTALVRRGLPQSLALMLVYLAGVILLGALIYVISEPLSYEIQQSTDDLAVAYEQLKRQWPDGTVFQKTVAGWLPAPQDVYQALSGERGNTLLQALFDFTSGFFELVTKVVIVLILSIYWSADHLHFERLWLSVLPAGQRARSRDIWRDGEERIGGYIRGELVQSILAGLLLGSGYWLLGLKYPTLLALTGAIVRLIPMLGIVLAVVPALLMGMMSSLSQGIIAALYTFITLLVLEVVIKRRLFQQQLANPILVVLMIMIMADAFGIIGLLLAPPVAAAIQLAFSSLAKKQTFAANSTAPTRVVSDLHERLARLTEIIGSREETVPMEITNIQERLTRLVEKIDQALYAEQSTDLPWKEWTGR